MRLSLLGICVACVIASSMNCGVAKICGVLTLESGLGPGNYKHDTAAVHGLWPEVPPYGTSACIPPTGSGSPPTRVYECYASTGGNASDQLSFENHEWTKHGKCAGIKDADDFFTQLCALATGPLSAMNNAARSLDAMKTAVTAAGYEVFSVDSSNQQLSLSTCFNVSTGQWVLAAVSDFKHACGGSGPSPAPPGPPAPAPSGQCATGTQGPACSTDSDCTGFTGCVRCASSGHCTDIPKNKNVLIKRYNTTGTVNVTEATANQTEVL